MTLNRRNRCAQLSRDVGKFNRILNRTKAVQYTILLNDSSYAEMTWVYESFMRFLGASRLVLKRVWVAILWIGRLSCLCIWMLELRLIYSALQKWKPGWSAESVHWLSWATAATGNAAVAGNGRAYVKYGSREQLVSRPKENVFKGLETSSIEGKYLARQSVWFQVCVTKSHRAVPDCCAGRVDLEDEVVQLGCRTIQLHTGDVEEKCLYLIAEQTSVSLITKYINVA